MLYIFSIKFPLKHVFKEEKGLKKNYHELINQLMTNSSSIIMDQFYIKYEENFSLKFVMPPSVYQYIKAWEDL